MRFFQSTTFVMVNYLFGSVVVVCHTVVASSVLFVPAPHLQLCGCQRSFASHWCRWDGAASNGRPAVVLRLQIYGVVPQHPRPVCMGVCDCFSFFLDHRSIVEIIFVKYFATLHNSFVNYLGPLQIPLINSVPSKSIFVKYLGPLQIPLIVSVPSKNYFVKYLGPLQIPLIVFVTLQKFFVKYLATLQIPLIVSLPSKSFSLTISLPSSFR